MYDAKLSSRSVIHDSAGSAGRTMAEDLENPEDKPESHSFDQVRSAPVLRSIPLQKMLENAKACRRNQRENPRMIHRVNTRMKMLMKNMARMPLSWKKNKVSFLESMRFIP